MIRCVLKTFCLGELFVEVVVSDVIAEELCILGEALYEIQLDGY